MPQQQQTKEAARFYTLRDRLMEMKKDRNADPQKLADLERDVEDAQAAMMSALLVKGIENKTIQ